MHSKLDGVLVVWTEETLTRNTGVKSNTGFLTQCEDRWIISESLLLNQKLLSSKASCWADFQIFLFYNLLMQHIVAKEEACKVHKNEEKYHKCTSGEPAFANGSHLFVEIEHHVSLFHHCLNIVQICAYLYSYFNLNTLVWLYTNYQFM